MVLGEALVDVFASGPLAGGTLAKLVRQSAEDFGLSQAGFQKDDMHPTGSVVVVQKGQTHSFRIAADVAWDYIDGAQAQAATHGDPVFVYFGTLAQRHIVSKRAIRTIAQSSRAIRYLDLNLRNDPDSRRLAEESLALADWVKVNDEELMQLLAWSSGAAVLAQGWDGFSAMLMASHLAGCDLASALAMANAYAADICARCGPVPTDPQFYRDWRQQLAPRHGEVSHHV